MTNPLPVRVKELTEEQAQDMIDFGFQVTRIIDNMYVITFKKAVTK